MIKSTHSKTWTFTITLLVVAHICAIFALVGLSLFSPIVSEMGAGSMGVIIVSLTFITLTINAALLLRARKNLGKDFSASKRSLMMVAGIFLVYNLVATLLNPALLANLVTSIVVLGVAMYFLAKTGYKK